MSSFYEGMERWLTVFANFLYLLSLLLLRYGDGTGTYGDGSYYDDGTYGDGSHGNGSYDTGGNQQQQRDRGMPPVNEEYDDGYTQDGDQ